MQEPNRTLFDKVSSASEALLKFLASGAHQVSEEERNRRIDICLPCEFYAERHGVAICDQCGCVLNLKVRFPGESCPIDKWGSVKDPGPI